MIRFILSALAAILVCCLPASAQPDFPGKDELHRLRSERRAQHRVHQLQADKAEGPLLFGLLVIPVDFSDARLPADWDSGVELSSRLTASEAQSLRHYYQVASRQNLDLRMTLAPLISLPGSRRDYSDVGYQGFSRTRTLAREALEAVRALGLEFRALDMEGPDRRPGSMDDDGQLDGVLILHAGVGQENDPVRGLIQPLQFFLDEPVVSGGIQASFYAVASLQSGPGIWAHETGHLLGMEDRYDPLLHPEANGVDVRSVGGLGRFSLMASGAWGTGDGWSPALPDAYTCWQLGWYDGVLLPVQGQETTLLSPGTAARIWTHGQPREEFFLLETRDPENSLPYDAGLPGNQLLIYHIDESVPEGSWTSDGPGQWHLRARLVEADDDQALARGENDGRESDLFPGSEGVTSWGPTTSPSSWGYQGNSLVSLNSIVSLTQGVEFQARASDGPRVVFEFGFTGSPSAQGDLVAFSQGDPLETLNCRLEVLAGGAAGFFPGGLGAVDLVMIETTPGRWEPAEEWTFTLEQDPTSGQSTDFSVTFSSGSWTGDSVVRTWSWRGGEDLLDFPDTWPGTWSVQDLNPGTTWHRWAGPPYLGLGESPLLIATGQSHTSAEAWPDNRYTNGAHTLLQTPVLTPEVRSVRIIHAIGAERLDSGEAMDGGRLIWIGPEESTQPAVPIDGYTNRISTQSNNPLGGQPVFADTVLTAAAGDVFWQIDLVPLPEGPGPWRLGFEFASNTLWRRQGWLLADARANLDPGLSSPFPVYWSGTDGLSWSFPAEDLPVETFSLEYRAPQSGGWTEALSGLTGNELSAATILGILGPGSPFRHEIRLVALTARGRVASRPVTIYPDGGYRAISGLGLPRPNPSLGQVSIQVDTPEGRSAQLKIFDLKGRLLHRRQVAGGSQLIRWDGDDQNGRRLPAGLYFLRLEGSGPPQTRKVVLLR